MNYIVKWQSRFTTAAGIIGPTTRSVAEQIAITNNRLFPDIDHWTEQVAGERAKVRHHAVE